MEHVPFDQLSLTQMKERLLQLGLATYGTRDKLINIYQHQLKHKRFNLQIELAHLSAEGNWLNISHSFPDIPFHIMYRLIVESHKVLNNLLNMYDTKEEIVAGLPRWTKDLPMPKFIYPLDMDNILFSIKNKRYSYDFVYFIAQLLEKMILTMTRVDIYQVYHAFSTDSELSKWMK